MRTRWICVPVVLMAACGFGSHKKKVVEPAPIVKEEPPPPPPPPPPVCVIAGAEQSLIGMVEADAAAVKFCVSDGAESNKCYGVDIAASKYAEMEEAPKGQSPVLDPDPARIETTPKEVKVCIGEECKTIKPKVKKSENPIDAVVNATGTYVAVLVGNAEKGKGTVEVWSVATGKKTGTIKYAKGSYKCGEARMLGDTVYVSASVCGGSDARGYLYNLKGKKVADVGGSTFGTYGTVPLQVSETGWAFLEQNGSVIAVQDGATGKLDKTIDIGAVWAHEDGNEVGPMGNAGESALVRGGEGKLVVVTGGPKPGSVGVIDIAGGTVETSVAALACEAPAATEPAEGEEPADEEAPADEEGGE